MKKVLTVFLSIALVLAMMPAMAFANGNAEDTKLYCFNTFDVSVDDNGYLVAKSSAGAIEPVDAPELTI